jgi:hypothetical protein
MRRTQHVQVFDAIVSTVTVPVVDLENCRVGITAARHGTDLTVGVESSLPIARVTVGEVRVLVITPPCVVGRVGARPATVYRFDAINIAPSFLDLLSAACAPHKRCRISRSDSTFPRAVLLRGATLPIHIGVCKRPHKEASTVHARQID